MCDYDYPEVNDPDNKVGYFMMTGIETQIKAWFKKNLDVVVSVKAERE